MGSDLAPRNRPIYVDHDGTELTALEFAQKRVDPVELVDALREHGVAGIAGMDHTRVSCLTALLDRVWPKPQAAAPLQVNVGSLVVNVNFR